MEDQKMNEKESLELITQMIRNTRRNLDAGSGNLFLLWGYVAVAVTLIVAVGLYFTENFVWMSGFWGIPVIGYSLSFLLLRKREKLVKSYVDKVMGEIWMYLGMVCILFVWLAMYAGRPEFILPLCAVVLALGGIITGSIIRYTGFTVFSAFGLLWGMKSLFDVLVNGSSLLTLAWFAATVVFAMIIPGHILNTKARKGVEDKK